MRDENGGDGVRRLRAGLLLAGIAIAAARADAGPLGGVLTGQYQQVEQNARLSYPNGVVRDTTITQVFWSQSYELHHSRTLRHDLSLFTQFQLIDRSFTGRPHASLTLDGTVRIAHPIFGVAGTHRPTTTTSAPVLAGPPGAAPEMRTLKTHQDETLISGYLAPQGLPRLSLNWVRQAQRSDFGGPEQTNVARTARMTYGAGPLDVRAGYGDRSSNAPDPGRQVVSQRNGNAGAGLRLVETSKLSLSAQYDFAAYLSGLESLQNQRSRTHTASLSGSLRASERANWSLGYNFHHNEVRGRSYVNADDHDGSLAFGYTPNRITQVSASGGIHTLKSGPRSELRRFVTAAASAAGRIKEQWTGTAAASHATNWDPDGSVLSTESVRVSSNLAVSRDFQVNADLGTSLNSTGREAAGRVVTLATLGVTASPLRSLRLLASTQHYRSGPDFFSPATDAANRSFDLRWTPARGIDVAGSITQTKSGLGSGPSNTTRSAGVDYRPGPRLQLSGSYSRNDQRTTFAGGTQLRGQEAYTTRVTSLLGWGFLASADVQLIDPHGHSSARQFNAGLTKNFGR